MISKGLPQQVLIQHLKTAVSSLTDTRPRGYKNFGNSYSCFAQEKKKISTSDYTYTKTLNKLSP